MKTTATLILLFLSTCFLSAQKGNSNSDYKVKWNTGTENSREVCPQNNTRNYRFNNASAQACDNTSNRTIRQRAKVTLTNIGLDIPIFITRSLVDVPNGLRGTITDHFGGVGYDFGLGLNLDFSNNMSLKFGLHKRNKSFNAKYNAFAEGLGGNEMDFFIEENGSFNYWGLYLKAHRNFDSFFVGGGFEVSLNKKYNVDYKVLNSAGNVVDKKTNISNSPLIENYNHQIDFSIIAGLRVKINEKLLVKPAIELTAIPMRPIINTGVYYTSPIDNQTNEVNITVFAVKLGAIIEFKLN